MGTITLYVPTISDTPTSFDTLFKLWAQVDRGCVSVHLDLSKCRFLSQSAIAFLGGLIRLIQQRGGTVTLDWDESDPVIQHLKRNGFSGAFGLDAPQVSVSHSGYFREYPNQDKDDIVDYLSNNWLRTYWVHVSEKLHNAVVGTVWEIFANAFEHGESPVGVFVSGQFYRKLKTLKLTVVDFGVGIPHKVRGFLGNSGMAADTALEWAFQPGTTTQGNGTGRGLGLDLLKDFVRVNQGKLEVFSHEGYAIVDKDGDRYMLRDTHFAGTVVNITLICDENLYCLSTELASEIIF